MKLLFALAAMVIALALPATAAGQGEPPPPGMTNSDAWADRVAMRNVDLVCVTAKEADDMGAWGWVWTDDPTTIYLAPQICTALAQLEVGVSDEDLSFMHGLAVLVLTHESYHSRIWALWGDEAAVECRAIRHVRVALEYLHVTGKQLYWLREAAIQAHWSIVAQNPEYYSETCVVPKP